MADKVLPQRVSVLGGLPSSGWPGLKGIFPNPGMGREGRMVELELVEASHCIFQSADPGACPRVSGIHGSLSF